MVLMGNAYASPLETIENYLNQLTTFKAEFRQFTINAPGVSEGIFYLQRPKQFLWQYEYPHQQKIISTGSGAYFYDPENEQVTQIPINSGFGRIFTQKEIRLQSKHFTVKEERELAETLEVTLKPTEDSTITELTFVVKKDPIQLSQIVSKDAFGDTNIVVFSVVEERVIFNESLFDFVPPHYDDGF
jgi:chaperone LolA